MSEQQISIVSLDKLVCKNNQYRKFKKLFAFKAIEYDLIAIKLTIITRTLEF